MRRNPETKVLLEQALRHVLQEQAKLIFHSDADQLRDTVMKMNELALATTLPISAGFKSRRDLEKLRRQAVELEKGVDDLSEEFWRPLPISVSPVFQRLEESLDRREGVIGSWDETKAHFHDMRIRLLEQTIGARALMNSNDLGDENERVWLQFLERQLGSMFRVLRGGFILDYQGNRSGQIDLLVTAADEHVMVPGDSEDGKAMVYVDQVISAIMVTSTLDSEKLRKDWLGLQKIPEHPAREKDFANSHLRKEPWPLCYIVASQSDEPAGLVKTWETLCLENHTRLVPQLVMTLDSGFFYGGSNALVWPHPHTNSFDTEAANVGRQSGVHAGLGLGWILLQHQARLASVHRRQLAPIGRQCVQLSRATAVSATPATWSRFNKSFEMCPIAGVLEWGPYGNQVHNRLRCRTMFIRETESKWIHFKVPDAEPEPTHGDWADWGQKNLRWFRRDESRLFGKWFFVEELLNRRSKAEHSRRVVIFNTVTGEEIAVANPPKELPESDSALVELGLV